MNPDKPNKSYFLHKGRDFPFPYKAKKLNAMYHYFVLLVQWLASATDSSVVLLGALVAYVTVVFKIAGYRGIREAINYNKENRKIFLKVVFNDLDADEDWKRIPKHVRKIATACKRSENPTLSLRVALSVFYMTRAFNLEAIPSFRTIEKEPGFTGDPSILRKDMKNFLREIGVKITPMVKPWKVNFTKYHFSAKAGPNGPSLLSAVMDYLSLPQSLKDDLSVMGGGLLATHMKHM